MQSSLLSDVFGWISIGCWLGAQFPQVLENIRRQSCEGLALPFLFNWLLGDITNLIGCVLTHQLPFQTILASYFVSVDFMLFSQYFYYRPRKAKSEVTATGPLVSSSPVRQYNSHGRRFSTDIDHHHYRELSTAAANVAIAAAIAAASSEEELYDSPRVRDSVTPRPAHKRRSSTSITRSEAAEAEDEVDDAALAALADSFHSEGGRKRVSWSQERYGSGSGRGGSSTSRTRSSGHIPISALAPLHTTAVETVVSGRGRPLERQVVDSPIDIRDFERADDGIGRSVSRSVVRDRRRNSRASQRSVGLVFLGVWALFGIGTFPRRSYSSASPHGLVLSNDTTAAPVYQILRAGSPPTPNTFVEPSGIELSFEQSGDKTPDEPSSERIIGRIFAWMCTTLYLTSRLPQIWKNFIRKSVEGLSMFLFVFAFLGNTFYVLSILSSPKMSQPRPASTAFLLESIPYLLGSGGTLLFDVTIVSQSFLYRPKPGHARHVRSHSHHSHLTHSHHPRHRASHSRSRTNSHAQILRSSVYGSGSFEAAPEEGRALLRSESVDLERAG